MFFPPRLSAMLEALREILIALVPERDHMSVSHNLDVSLLMQQVSRGVLNFVALSSWLAALLKTHCAPMRDELADKMVRLIETGCRNQEMAEVVQGLQTLFHMLEAMKLVSQTSHLTQGFSHRSTLKSSLSCSPQIFFISLHHPPYSSLPLYLSEPFLPGSNSPAGRMSPTIRSGHFVLS